MEGLEPITRAVVTSSKSTYSLFFSCALYAAQNVSAEAEDLLKAGILRELDNLGADQRIMLKLTIPDEDGFYSDLISDARVLRIVALSGGYSRTDADEKLARNPGLIASFSRALLDGLTAQQSQDEFDKTLDEAITEIYQASLT